MRLHTCRRNSPKRLSNAREKRFRKLRRNQTEQQFVFWQLFFFPLSLCGKKSITWCSWRAWRWNPYDVPRDGGVYMRTSSVIGLFSCQEQAVFSSEAASTFLENTFFFIFLSSTSLPAVWPWWPGHLDPWQIFSLPFTFFLQISVRIEMRSFCNTCYGLLVKGIKVKGINWWVNYNLISPWTMDMKMKKQS
jgi:hypothetical protein